MALDQRIKRLEQQIGTTHTMTWFDLLKASELFKREHPEEAAGFAAAWKALPKEEQRARREDG